MNHALTRRSLLPLTLAVFAGWAPAQELDEIEAWVFEPSELVNCHQSLVSWQTEPFINNSGVITGNAIEPTSSSTADIQPYVIDEHGERILRDPGNTSRTGVVGIDDAGRIYGTNNEAPGVYVWIDEHPRTLPVPSNTRVQLLHTSSGGHSVGLVYTTGSTKSTPLRESPLAIYTDPDSGPQVIQPLIFPYAESTGANKGFQPQLITNGGMVFGHNLGDSQPFTLSLGCRMPDGTLLEAPIIDLAPDARITFATHFSPAGPRDAYVVCREFGGMSPSFVVKFGASGTEVIAEGDYPHIVGHESGLYLFTQPNSALISDGTTSLPLDTRIASSQRVRLGDGISSINAHAELVTWCGILRPTTCLADTNRDGSLDTQDFMAWLDAFLAGDSIADQNLDQDISPADFTAWIDRFDRGCNTGG